MSASRWSAVILTALALALAGGCGGDDDENGADGNGAPQNGAQTAPQDGEQTAPEGDEQTADVQQTFAQTCGGCHVLGAADTRGQVGPSLDELRPDRATVLAAIQNGPGVMPANLLEGPEADEVADYVAENAGG
jgi:mono/diheme cytochrome c family protein